MKNKIKNTAVLKLIGLILIVFTISSCASYKEKTKEAITTTENTEFQKSLDRQKEIVERSKEIFDNFKLNIPKSNTGDPERDKEIDQKIDQILKSVNTSKSSGDNSYSIGYNAAKRELEGKFKVAATEDRNKTAIKSDSLASSSKVEKSFFEKSIKKIKVIPFWVWVVLFIFLHRPLLMILAFFFPWLKSLSFLTNILSPKKSINENQ